MDTDPWLWDVDKVAHFFRHTAKGLVQDIPFAELEGDTCERLAKRVEEHEIAGSVLLSDLFNAEFLQHDCQIRATPRVGTILNCITKLKKEARTSNNEARAIITTPNASQLAAKWTSLGYSVDDNPWQWNVQEVAHFFRHKAAGFIRDIPNIRLGDVDRLASCLERYKVAGSTLLSGAINTEFLCEECDIESLGRRSAVVYCIVRLREWVERFNV